MLKKRIEFKISKSYSLIERSREKIPKVYDFKPYDVFSDKKLFLKCINKATKRLKNLMTWYIVN